MSDTPVVRPTPTQEELDRHVRGERLSKHEHDGSPEHPGMHAHNPHHHAKEDRMMVPEGMQHIPPQPAGDGDEKKGASGTEGNLGDKHPPGADPANKSDTGGEGAGDESEGEEDDESEDDSDSTNKTVKPQPTGRRGQYKTRSASGK